MYNIPILLILSLVNPLPQFVVFLLNSSQYTFMHVVLIKRIIKGFYLFQSFSPLLFVDVLSNQKKYHFNKLGQVFVEIQPPESLCSA